MNIKDLIKMAHANAVAKGFYEREQNVGERLMLVVSELSEALEADRNNRGASIGAFDIEVRPTMLKVDERGEIVQRIESPIFKEAFTEHIKDTFEDELADAVIRIADMCGAMGIDLERHIELKMAYNETRPHKHGKAY